ncbi:MAG: hypothetical protein PHZ25_02985 [Candidatus Pacebacteria bacterium]|nr:hypothetical protein [Candidatus Paceibacterota bacterium]
MKNIEGFLIAAETKKNSRKIREKILFGSKKGENGLYFMFGFKGFEVFEKEEEVKEVALKFPKAEMYKEVFPVKVRIEIPKFPSEFGEFRKKGSFVIFYSSDFPRTEIFGPFRGDFSQALEGEVGYLMENGWVTFCSFKEVSTLAEDLYEKILNIRLASLRIFDLNENELTRPELASF